MNIRTNEVCNLLRIILENVYTLVEYISFQVRKVVGEPWFPGLTSKKVLNKKFYWNKCTLYLETETLLKHYHMYTTLFIEITQSVQFVVTSVS
jgi:hypothetical protein